MLLFDCFWVFAEKNLLLFSDVFYLLLQSGFAVGVNKRCVIELANFKAL